MYRAEVELAGRKYGADGKSEQLAREALRKKLHGIVASQPESLIQSAHVFQWQQGPRIKL